MMEIVNNTLKKLKVRLSCHLILRGTTIRAALRCEYSSQISVGHLFYFVLANLEENVKNYFWNPFSFFDSQSVFQSDSLSLSISVRCRTHVCPLVALFDLDYIPI